MSSHDIVLTKDIVGASGSSLHFCMLIEDDGIHSLTTMLFFLKTSAETSVKLRDAKQRPLLGLSLVSWSSGKTLPLKIHLMIFTCIT